MKKLGFGMLAMIVSLAVFVMPVSALSVGFAYSQDEPVQVAPGESLQVSAGLQYADGTDSSLTMTPNLVEGSEYVTFSDAPYVVEPQGFTEAPMVITVPSDAVVGTTYDVQVVFESSSEEDSQGTGAQLQTNLGLNFAITVVEPEPEPEAPAPEVVEEEGSSGMIWWIIGVVVVALAVVIVVMKRKGSSNPAPAAMPESAPAPAADPSASA